MLLPLLIPKKLFDGLSWFGLIKKEHPEVEQQSPHQKTLESEPFIDKLARSWAYASQGIKMAVLFTAPLLGIALGATALLSFFFFVVGLSLHGFLTSYHAGQVKQRAELIEERKLLKEREDAEFQLQEQAGVVADIQVTTEQLINSLDKLVQTQQQNNTSSDELSEKLVSARMLIEGSKIELPELPVLDLSIYKEQTRCMDEELKAFDERMRQRRKYSMSELLIDDAIIQRHRESLAKTDELLARTALTTERNLASLSLQQETVKKGGAASNSATDTSAALLADEQSHAAQLQRLESRTQSLAELQERLRALSDLSSHENEFSDHDDFINYIEAEFAARSERVEAQRAEFLAHSRFFTLPVAQNEDASDTKPHLSMGG